MVVAPNITQVLHHDKDVIMKEVPPLRSPSHTPSFDSTYTPSETKLEGCLTNDLEGKSKNIKDRFEEFCNNALAHIKPLQAIVRHV